MIEGANTVNDGLPEAAEEHSKAITGAFHDAEGYLVVARHQLEAAEKTLTILRKLIEEYLDGENEEKKDGVD